MTAPNAILVCGGAGYIGSHMCKRLMRAGYAPITFDNLSTGHRWAVKWGPLLEGDLLDPVALANVFREYRIAAVMHFAARSLVGESMQQPGLYFHSDRGSQYASEDFRDVLKDYGFSASMSRRGNCWDNACSETLFGSLKAERLHGQRFPTRRHAKDEALAWLFWYNQSRLHSTLNYISPMQFEQHWRTAQTK